MHFVDHEFFEVNDILNKWELTLGDKNYMDTYYRYPERIRQFHKDLKRVRDYVDASYKYWVANEK